MILLTLILIFAATSFTTCTATNPLTMGLLILFMALTLSVSFSTSMSSWVALLIFLIYIGGILVMFSYFVALTPNQNIYMTKPVVMMFSSLLLLSMMSFIYSIKAPMLTDYTSQMSIMYEGPNIPTLIMLALILLFAMVVVVKISVHTKGPLRPFFKYV